ncbi:MAG: ABC transporter permease [Deferribacterales bacterium]
MHDPAKDISLISMILLYLFSGALIAFTEILKLNMLKEFLISLFRMSIQLFLGSIILLYIFKINTLWIVMAFFVLMSIVASITIIKKSKIKKGSFIYINVFVVTLLVTFIFQFFIIQHNLWYDARYFITIAGMIMGNSMNASALALERFKNEITENYDLVKTFLSFGANDFEAISLFFRKSLKASLIPIITNMSSIGIVFFPGMMTGQILAGSDPTIAVKYQIAIMIMISISVLITTFLNLFFLMKNLFKYGIIKNEL